MTTPTSNLEPIYSQIAVETANAEFIRSGVVNRLLKPKPVMPTRYPSAEDTSAFKKHEAAWEEKYALIQKAWTIEWLRQKYFAATALDSKALQRCDNVARLELGIYYLTSIKNNITPATVKDHLRESGLTGLSKDFVVEAVQALDAKFNDLNITAVLKQILSENVEIDLWVSEDQKKKFNLSQKVFTLLTCLYYVPDIAPHPHNIHSSAHYHVVVWGRGCTLSELTNPAAYPHPIWIVNRIYATKQLHDVTKVDFLEDYTFSEIMLTADWFVAAQTFANKERFEENAATVLQAFKTLHLNKTAQLAGEPASNIDSDSKADAKVLLQEQLTVLTSLLAAERAKQLEDWVRVDGYYRKALKDGYNYDLPTIDNTNYTFRACTDPSNTPSNGIPAILHLHLANNEKQVLKVVPKSHDSKTAESFHRMDLSSITRNSEQLRDLQSKLLQLDGFIKIIADWQTKVAAGAVLTSQDSQEALLAKLTEIYKSHASYYLPEIASDIDKVIWNIEPLLKMLAVTATATAAVDAKCVPVAAGSAAAVGSLGAFAKTVTPSAAATEAAATFTIVVTPPAELPKQTY